MSYYREQMEKYLSGLDIKATLVIDLGGEENPIKGRVKNWEVGEYKIFDLPHYDINEVNPEDEADIVFCLEVFEYVWNPNIAVTNLYDLLKIGGTLYATFPTLYPVHNPYEIDYLRYTKFGILKLLEDKFRVEEIIPRKIKEPELYTEHINAEGYRYKGASQSGTLFDAGYIIKARKI